MVGVGGGNVGLDGDGVKVGGEEGALLRKVRDSARSESTSGRLLVMWVGDSSLLVRSHLDCIDLCSLSLICCSRYLLYSFLVCCICCCLFGSGAV